MACTPYSAVIVNGVILHLLKQFMHLEIWCLLILDGHGSHLTAEFDAILQGEQHYKAMYASSFLTSLPTF
jgi:hypothetical protein